MSIAKMVEVSAQSTISFEDAIKQGIAFAADGVYEVTNAWVKDQKVCVKGGEITEYRVHLKVSCVLSDAQTKTIKATKAVSTKSKK